jgi:hypothetical protein
MAATPRHVVRPRTLPPHLRTDALHTVYDVTEAHTTRPGPWGVHTSPARARAHADRLDRRAAQAAAAEQAQDDAELIRARIAARVKRETEGG